MKAVVILSKTFPPKHPNAGRETYFSLRVKCGQKLKNNRNLDCLFPYCGLCEMYNMHEKIHTCRSNHAYWEKKINRLKEVGGVLSIRQWSGYPYRSKQEIIVDIPAEYAGIQRVMFAEDMKGVYIDDKFVCIEDFAGNDGLSSKDFQAWFKDYDLSKPLAIIHFTKYRY